MLSRILKRGVSVALGISLLQSGGGNFPTYYLAPTSHFDDFFFILSPTQISQARNLVQILDLVIPFLESREKQRELPPDPRRIQEEDIFDYVSKHTGKNESLIPAFRFFNAFGLSNLKGLREDLNKVVKGEYLAPRAYFLELQPPIGLYRFSRLTQSLKDTGILQNLDIKFFSPYYILAEGADIPVETIRDYNEWGIEAFTLVGERAQRAAQIVFNPADPKRTRLKQKLLNQAAAARRLCAAIRELAAVLKREKEGESESLKQQVRFRASQYTLLGVQFDILRLLDTEEGIPLAESLSEIKQKIEERLIVIDGRDGETISYFNLVAFTHCPKTDKYGLGIVQIELNLEALLAWSSNLNSYRALVQEIVYRLPVPQVGEGEKPPAVPVGAYEVNLSHALSAFPSQTFQDPYIFYNLLKILTATRFAVPFYQSNLDEHLYGLELRQNVLNALQRAFPDWFRHSLNYLDQKITIADEQIDPYDTEVDFLAATGWVDTPIAQRLRQERENKVFVAQVKSILLRGFAVTQELLPKGMAITTWDKGAATASFLPSSLSLADPLNRLKLLNFIKAKTFLSQGNFTATTSELAFLSPEDLKEFASRHPTLAHLVRSFSTQLWLNRVRLRLRGLYDFISRYIQDMPAELPRASLMLVEKAQSSFPFMGMFPTLAEIKPDKYGKGLRWIFYLLKSFLSTDLVFDFWRRLVYYFLWTDVKETLNDVFDDCLALHVRGRIEDSKLNFPLLNNLLEELLRGYEPSSDPNENQRRVEAHLVTLKSELEEGGRYEGIQYLAHPDVFLGDLQQMLLSAGANLPDAKQKFIQSLVRNRFRQACERVQNQLIQELDEAFQEGVSLGQLRAMTYQVKLRALILVREQFKNDRYLEEIGQALEISKLVSSVMKGELSGRVYTDRDFGRFRKKEETKKVLEIAYQFFFEFNKKIPTESQELEAFFSTPPEETPEEAMAIIGFRPLSQELEAIFSASSQEKPAVESCL